MFSDTDHLGGNMTKSATAVPGFNEGHVKTVNIYGSFFTKKVFSNTPPKKRSFYYSNPWAAIAYDYVTEGYIK